ncbi:hypothetical protein [Clostridium sp. AM58-1XD]|uniref:hypothetical protein n=1 Tax=Clostridium sp. AM58-1XD TaxID=2292307 RepID=UPI000E46C8EE|nr:hypothetical protein [Clostridium sp. AM58-1XD]RGZ01893.1 hypothetical protein DXA13_00905 [Clostridium sp. AM58-1XD]
MRVELTQMSEKNIDYLMGREKTPREIVEFLKEEAVIRKFSDTLRRIYQKDDLVWRLTDGISRSSGEETGSVARKVRNWLSDRNIPQNRETLFQICFSLDMGTEETEKILRMTSESGIHYRNPKEVVYAYALKKKLSYEAAQNLLQKVTEIEGESESGKEEDTRFYTQLIMDELKDVDSTEELAEFFRRNKGRMGELHNTAYRKFRELMRRLKSPEGAEQESRYGMNRISDRYLRLNVPLTKESADFTMLQKIVKKYWPNSRKLQNMYTRKEDVSRKALILLYTSFEFLLDEEQEEEDSFLDDDYLDDDPDTRLELRFENMNRILDECGMSRLDPCCPFDYLILYSMKTQEEEYMDEKIKAVIAELFDSEQGE